MCSLVAYYLPYSATNFKYSFFSFFSAASVSAVGWSGVEAMSSGDYATSALLVVIAKMRAAIVRFIILKFDYNLF